MTKECTAIIDSIDIGIPERLLNIWASVKFRTSDDGFFVNNLSIAQISDMLRDTKKTNVMDLIGMPCQVNAGWGEKCSFIKMWRQ